MRPYTLAGAMTLAIMACGNGGGAGEALSTFRQDELVTGRVIDNSTACQVDAICSLELAFADTSIIAIYGTGMRQAPPCQSPAEVTNVAFAVARDELVGQCLLDRSSQRPQQIRFALSRERQLRQLQP